MFRNGIWALICCVGVIGCAPGEPSAQNASKTAVEDDHDDHDHGHDHGAAPHGGAVADWGGGIYHLEFTVDHDKQTATVYVLGEDVKTPVPISAETLSLSIDEPAIQVELTADPQEGETGGKASRFTGQHEGLGTVREFSGTISGEVEGTPYAGDFKETAGEHAHDH